MKWNMNREIVSVCDAPFQTVSGVASLAAAAVVSAGGRRGMEVARNGTQLLHGGGPSWPTARAYLGRWWPGNWRTTMVCPAE